MKAMTVPKKVQDGKVVNWTIIIKDTYDTLAFNGVEIVSSNKQEIIKHVKAFNKAIREGTKSPYSIVKFDMDKMKKALEQCHPLYINLNL